MGDLGQMLAAQHVRARVADVHQPDLTADEAQRGQGGAHAVQFAVGGDRLGDARVGVLDGTAQFGEQVRDGAVLVETFHCRDGDLAGHLARGVAAHAVGDSQQAGTRVDRVLVVAAHQSTVRAHGVAQREGHRATTPDRLGRRIMRPPCGIDGLGGWVMP